MTVNPRFTQEVSRFYRIDAPPEDVAARLSQLSDDDLGIIKEEMRSVAHPNMTPEAFDQAFFGQEGEGGSERGFSLSKSLWAMGDTALNITANAFQFLVPALQLEDQFLSTKRALYREHGAQKGQAEFDRLYMSDESSLSEADIETIKRLEQENRKGRDEFFLERVGDSIKGFSEEYIRPDNLLEWSDLDGAPWMVFPLAIQELIRSAPYMVAATLPGMAVVATSIGNEVQRRRSEAPTMKDIALALLAGGGVAALQGVGAKAMLFPFKGIGNGAMVRVPERIAARVAKGAGIAGTAEGITETAQQFIDNAASIIGTDKWKAMSDEEKLAALTKGGFQSAVLGSIGGGTLGAATGAISRPRRKDGDNQEEEGAPDVAAAAQEAQRRADEQQAKEEAEAAQAEAQAQQSQADAEEAVQYEEATEEQAQREADIAEGVAAAESDPTRVPPNEVVREKIEAEMSGQPFPQNQPSDGESAPPPPEGRVVQDEGQGNSEFAKQILDSEYEPRYQSLKSPESWRLHTEAENGTRKYIDADQFSHGQEIVIDLLKQPSVKAIVSIDEDGNVTAKDADGRVFDPRKFRTYTPTEGDSDAEADWKDETDRLRAELEGDLHEDTIRDYEARTSDSEFQNLPNEEKSEIKKFIRDSKDALAKRREGEKAKPEAEARVEAKPRKGGEPLPDLPKGMVAQGEPPQGDFQPDPETLKDFGLPVWKGKMNAGDLVLNPEKNQSRAFDAERLKDLKRFRTEGNKTFLALETTDGTREVVDGHNRKRLMDRLIEKGKMKAYPEIDAIVLREADGWTRDKVLQAGAEMNVINGTATPWDIALATKDMESKQELDDKGWPDTDRKLGVGWSIGRLADSEIEWLRNEGDVTGTGKGIRETYAAAVGEVMPGKTEELAQRQRIALQMIRDKGVANVEQARMMASFVRNQDSLGKIEEGNLFGEDHSSAIARASAIMASADKTLGNKKALGRIGRTKSGDVERENIGNINKEDSAALETRAAEAREVLKKRAFQGGTPENAELNRLVADESIKEAEAGAQLAAFAMENSRVAGGTQTTPKPEAQAEKTPQAILEAQEEKPTPEPKAQEAEKEDHFDGMGDIPQREFLERQAAKPNAAKRPQMPMPTGGIFDMDARDQVDLEDAVKAKGKADAEAGKPDIAQFDKEIEEYVADIRDYVDNDKASDTLDESVTKLKENQQSPTFKKLSPGRRKEIGDLLDEWMMKTGGRTQSDIKAIREHEEEAASAFAELERGVEARQIGDGVFLTADSKPKPKKAVDSNKNFDREIEGYLADISAFLEGETPDTLDESVDKLNEVNRHPLFDSLTSEKIEEINDLLKAWRKKSGGRPQSGLGPRVNASKAWVEAAKKAVKEKPKHHIHDPATLRLRQGDIEPHEAQFIYDGIVDAVKRILPANVAMKMTDPRSRDYPKGWQGAFRFDQNSRRHIIEVATSADNPMTTIGHEAIHALREFALFSEVEWKALKRIAEKRGWFKTYRVATRYPEFFGKDGKPTEQAYEEAIADAFGDRLANGKKWEGADNRPFIFRMFSRMFQFFRNVADLVRDLDGRTRQSPFDTDMSAERIFAAIESGKIAARVAVSRERSKIRFQKSDPDSNAPLPALPSKEVEERTEATREIEKGRQFYEKIVEAVRESWHSATRVWKHLPEIPEFSDLREKLIHLLNALNTHHRTAEIFHEVTKGLSRNQIEAVNRYLMFMDMRSMVKMKIPLSFGLKPEDVKPQIEAIADWINANSPELWMRIHYYQREHDALTKDLIRYGILQPDAAIKNPYHVRHWFVLYKHQTGLGTGRERKLSRAKNILGIERKGSAEKDYVFDFVQGQINYFERAFHDVAMAKFIRWLTASKYNVRTQWEKAAKAENEENLAKAVEEDPSVQEHIAKAKQDIAIAYDILRRALKRHDPNDLKTPLPAHLRAELDRFMDTKKKVDYNDGGASKHVSLIHHLSDLESFPDVKDAAARIQARWGMKRKVISDILGDEYIDPQDIYALLKKYDPKGEYKIFQIDAKREGERVLQVFNINSFPDYAIENMMSMVRSMGMDIEGISGEQLAKLNAMLEGVKNVKAVGGLREAMIVRNEAAETFNNFHDKPPEGVGVIAATGSSLWKQLVLFVPTRYAKYILNNFSGDMDALIAQGAFKSVHSIIKNEAGSMVWRYMKHGEIHPVLSEAMNRGVLAAQSFVEIGDIITQQQINRLLAASSRKEARNELIRMAQKYANAVDAGRAYLRFVQKAALYRENVYRLAAYIHYKKQLEAGKSLEEIGYGATPPKMAESITDQKDLAARLARDTMGDYAGLSETMRAWRRHHVPFVSWIYSNAVRYINIFRNALHMAKVHGKKGGLFSASAVLSIKLMKVLALYVGFQAWNLLAAGDEDERLSVDERTRLRVTAPFSIGGKTVSMNFSGAFYDFASWFGAEAVVAEVIKMTRGRANPFDVAFAAGKAPINKAVTSLNPLYKTTFEAVSGYALWPDAFNLRHISDPHTHHAQVIAAEWPTSAVSKALGKSAPSRDFLTNLAGLLFKVRDPGELSYRKIRGIGFEHHGRETDRHGSYTSPKHKAMSRFFRALTYGDDKSARLAYDDIVKLNDGNRVKANKSVKRSLQRRAPLGMLSKDDRKKVMLTLNPLEIDQLKEADAWYKKWLVEKVTRFRYVATGSGN